MRVKVYKDTAGGEFHWVDAESTNPDWPPTWVFVGYAYVSVTGTSPIFDEAREGSEG